jgi:hypothetical protein
MYEKWQREREISYSHPVSTVYGKGALPDNLLMLEIPQL